MAAAWSAIVTVFPVLMMMADFPLWCTLFPLNCTPLKFTFVAHVKLADAPKVTTGGPVLIDVEPFRVGFSPFTTGTLTFLIVVAVFVGKPFVVMASFTECDL